MCLKSNPEFSDKFKELNPTLEKYAKVEGSLITILQKAQSIYGYLSLETINYISEVTGIAPAKIYGVATFYAQFRLQPIGKYLIMMCQGTACHVNGSDSIGEAISEHLNIKDGETTDVRNRGDIDITDNEYPMAIMEYKLPFFEGYPDDTFRPNNTIIRAEMATVFARILGLEGHEYTGNKSFSDLDGHWAKNNILLVAEYGLLNGYKDGSFKPDGEMKRAEICSIINKYWELKGFEPNIEDADISDVDNHWAKELILGLYNHRFVDLNEQNAFRPDEPLKRDEVAQILNRITDRTIKANYTPSYKDVGKSHWAFKEVEAASNVSE